MTSPEPALTAPPTGAPSHSLMFQPSFRPDPAQRLYCVEEAARLLSLGRTAVFELVRTGELRSVKVGRSRRIPATALDEFVSRLVNQAGEAA
ncbi:helix-turn-helix domain-containing protein [Cryptosporangium sp. NPDC051539]|uniref:helix-turn-helix domain-containing protein n=1 Tax=Cryptosporangium sp. NPDC051539 TaxID=3363962 RepID=UPI0037ABFF07